MYRKRRPLEKPQINMTPMIDVVFLLLTFFVLTFRIIVPEGDFNVEMSPMGHDQPVEVEPDSVQIRLIAHADGSLSAIQFNDEDIEHFALLRQRVAAIGKKNADLEVVLFPDEHLRFEHTVEAITAVSGIYDNIKFARQKCCD
jgi:biopolymer transport protein ExbD